ncbi:F0F1 ATP synthase subunit B [Chelativorans sp. SCAU2101]|jgi:F0F1-type ATP synthase, subunit b|uniref:ATP synthase subunit b n=1 Tax=Chelativorans petroleitrophicus TaxID=2975484 RepID=A0A9X3BA55_9HYPH|nr:F0F1 ATP synthase subunit B [Chelativorans petroleitrophicus]MCT8991386.1 F0F1 ATP synthase subunit B [Chelativorans petroleitrophicus]
MFVASAYAQAAEPPAGDLHTETGVAVDHAPEGSFPPFDSSTFPSQLLWLAITFGLFYLFLKRVALPRIASILEVRRDRIAQDLDEAARMKEEADAAVAAYEQELAEARRKAAAIAQEARDAAKAEAEAERRKVEAALETKLEEAESRISEIKSAALADVGTIAEETAGAIVEQLVGGRVDKKALAEAVKAVQS